jgi:hypothetical protein
VVRIHAGEPFGNDIQPNEIPANERISENPVLVNTTEKVTPPKFSIRVFGSVSVSGSHSATRFSQTRLPHKTNASPKSRPWLTPWRKLLRRNSPFECSDLCRSRGANILLRKLVLRLNTDWDAADAGRSLLQLFQMAKAKICSALNLRESRWHRFRRTGNALGPP